MVNDHGRAGFVIHGLPPASVPLPRPMVQLQATVIGVTASCAVFEGGSGNMVPLLRHERPRAVKGRRVELSRSDGSACRQVLPHGLRVNTFGRSRVLLLSMER
jgi:hypothetical protein